MLNVSVSMCQASVALGIANVRYWSMVTVRVHRELRRWEAHAALIADPSLRAHARAKLDLERFNAEVAATLATLAPRQWRTRTITAIVAFQVMYDYLDAVSEQIVADPLRNGHQLYRAFTDALSDSAETGDYYHHHPQGDDSGYLEALVSTFRYAFQQLPSAAVVAPIARRTAGRCGEAQTRTHAIPREGVAQLATWAVTEAAETGLAWWEVAAGAAASVLAVHALIAAAADPRTSAAEAARIDVAYLPISALTTLLDSVIDHDRDAGDGSHGYVAYYPSRAAAAGGIGAVARQGTTAASALRHAPHHVMTVAGAAAYYLSAPGADSEFARPITQHVISELQPLITPILRVFQVWRFAKRVRDRTHGEWDAAQLDEQVDDGGIAGPIAQ